MRVRVHDTVSAARLSRVYEAGEQLMPDDEALWLISVGGAESLEPETTDDPPEGAETAEAPPPPRKKRNG